MSGLLGTAAPIESDLNLLLQIIILIMLLTGAKFAKEKTSSGIRKHERTMTIVVVLNAISFLFVMGPSFSRNFGAVLDETSIRGYPLTLSHALFGSIAEILGLMLIFRKFSNIRMWMRLTITVWLIASALGMIFYLQYFVI